MVADFGHLMVEKGGKRFFDLFGDSWRYAKEIGRR